MLDITFKLVDFQSIDLIIPLVDKLNKGKVSKSVLYKRFQEMFKQNYQCVGIFDCEKMIGVSGLWFCTRHYVGKSVELDHVFISEEYRKGGLGKKFMKWINDYCQSQGCNSMELNTYVNNYPSHKFYYNEGMEIWGYHFFKHL
ncbi:GNAT family N-acetyltransferase [Winogradskyella litorisediminis]|uniref:GNAT family N-acetyltransferase n=1 Tax=Winogradskyella litorisediminis TaxID=1156618 RepID=A0ABW3N9N3_9FLAO